MQHILTTLQQRRMQQLLSWLLLVGYMALLLHYSLSPVPATVDSPNTIQYKDKWQHIAAYCILTGILWWNGRFYHRRPLIIGIIFATAIGLGIEVIQSTLPSRVYDVADLGANALGTAMWALLIYGLSRYTTESF